MILKGLYRLSEYKIIEDENGALWWEAHTGLSRIKRGKCFIKGDILFIQAGKVEEPGFLKREFLDKLKSLPIWEKTQYYCLSPDIRSCRSGSKITQEEMQAWRQKQLNDSGKHNFLRDSIANDYPSTGLAQTEKASYKLGNCEIIEWANGQLWWRAHSGYNSLSLGSCIVLEDILFIGIKEKEEPENLKNRFLEYQKDLPEWVNTKYYCPKGTLLDCGVGKEIVEPRGILHTELPHTAEKRFLTTTLRKKLSYSSSPDKRQSQLIGSSVSLLKQMAGKIGNQVKQKSQNKKLVNKDIQVRGILKLTIWIEKVFSQIVGHKKWIAFIGASIIVIIVSLSLIFIHGYRDRWHEHQNDHYRKSSHHRGH